MITNHNLNFWDKDPLGQIISAMFTFVPFGFFQYENSIRIPNMQSVFQISSKIFGGPNFLPWDGYFLGLNLLFILLLKPRTPCGFQIHINQFLFEFFSQVSILFRQRKFCFQLSEYQYEHCISISLSFHKAKYISRKQIKLIYLINIYILNTSICKRLYVKQHARGNRSHLCFANQQKFLI